MSAKHFPTGRVRKYRAALRLAALVAVLSAIGASGSAQAQTEWVGDTSQDWNNAANWASDPNAPSGNFAINTAVAGVFPVSSADSVFTPVDIFVGNVAGATGRLDQTGGNLAVGSGNWLRMGEGGGTTGTFNMSGGAIFTGRVHMARVGGVAGTATINVTGAGTTLNSPGEIVVSDGQNNTATAQGTLNVGTGATVNAEGDLLIAFAGNASSFGEVNIAAGATVNVATATKRWLIVNQWDSQQGRLNVNGGTLNLNAVTDLRFSTGNGVGTSVVNLNSGAINMQAGSELDFNRGSNVGVNNTFNLNGGVLTVGRIMRNNLGAGAATRVFNFNGGTITPAASVANFFDLDSVTAANVRNGGAKFATNGFDVTAAQPLQHSNVGGDNAIDGGLTKSGAGVLTLSSALNSYTGPTIVSGGTLNVGGLTATSGVSVAAGATFGGSGTVVGTTTLNGGTLANSNPAVPLTVGAVTVGAAGSSINVNLSTAAAGIAVTGALTTGGNATTLNATKAIWTNGVQNLITFGSFSGSLGNFTFVPTGLNARQNAGALTNTGTGLAVTISGDNPKWTGADNGNWVTGTTGANKNWRLILGNTTTDYIQGDAVVFDDTATGTTTLDITSGGGVNPTTVNFNNSTKAYTINATGGGGIGGSGLLVKDGTNSVTLNSNNSYTGSTTINAGTLTLNGANTTTGATTLNGGTLNLGNATALSTGPLTIGAGGAKVLANTSGSAIIATANQVQSWNDNFTFAGPNDLDLGTGAVTVGGAGTDRTITVSGTSTFAVGELKAAAHGLIKQGTGTLALTSLGVNVDGSNIAGTLNVAQGTVQINRTSATGGDAFTGDLFVGGLAGSGTITNGAGQVRWLFVNQAAATTSTFNGLLENGAGGNGLGLVKRGAGTLTLGGANTMTDLVTIEDGTLNFTGAGSLASASGYFLPAGAGVLHVSSSSNVGSALINIASNGAAGPGGGSTARLEVSGNSTINAPIQLAPRNDTNGSDAIRNVSGNNNIAGVVTIITGGNQSRIRSDAGLLTLSGGITTAATGRNLYLQGAGNGEVSGQISNSINVFKEGTGTWTLSAFNAYTGITGAFGGILSITQPDSLSDAGDVSLRTGGTLNLTIPLDTPDTIDSLFINGISQPAGVYGAIGSGAQFTTSLITGTGRLNVLTFDLPGDFDNNNVVDAADLTAWQGGVTANNAAGDTDGDADSDGNDFLIWQRYLGQTYTPPTTPASGAVPEPTACMLLLMGSLGAIGARRAGMGRREVRG